MSSGTTRPDRATGPPWSPTPETPGLAPQRIFPVGGLVDEMTQYPATRETLDRWGAPEGNRLEWDCGHFGVTLRVMRTEAFQEFVQTALASPA